MILTVISGAPWLKHVTDRLICYTARGAPQCSCGLYALTWEGEGDDHDGA